MKFALKLAAVVALELARETADAAFEVADDALAEIGALLLALEPWFVPRVAHRASRDLPEID